MPQENKFCRGLIFESKSKSHAYEIDISCVIVKVGHTHILPFCPSAHRRLFWPKSKSFDYLYSDGEVLLRNFPVQATISFYDESESEDENDNEDDEEEWEEDDGKDSRSCLKHRAHFSSDN